MAFEDDAGGPDQKRQRKIAVSIDTSAKNADLAREIAATLEQPAVTLEISGGFELRDQDGVDMIAEGEIVTARPYTNMAAPARKAEPTLDTGLVNSAIECSPEEPVRVQIRLVTAELARAHARSTPKEQSAATNGLLAFDGEFVSGNTSLRALQQEASRVLGWASAEAMELDEAVCDHDHQEDGSCSCTIAQDIAQYGLSSTLHCRFTTDGSICGHQCPYSHAKLLLSSKPSKCSLCAGVLASLCPKCEDVSNLVVNCPLVQNAGCGHLHHAHCIGALKSRGPAACPSGCAIARFPRETVVFDREDTHLIIAWDGERIDRIPVPFTMNGVSRDSTSIVSITSAAVVTIVENFLERSGFTLPGLSLRIYSRDPVAELVRFSQSTLVSVCPSSSHVSLDHHRFPLFTGITRRNVLRPLGAFAVDLHTAQVPIIACGCTPIKRLFPRSDAATDPSVVLYAVKRRTEPPDTAAASDRPAVASKQSMYFADPAWHPSMPQTPRGISAFLASLYLLGHSVAQKTVAGEQKVLALAFAIFRFPPAVRTLVGLFLNRVPGPEEKAALSEAVYQALAEFSSRGPHAIVSRETRRFETVRIFLAYMASAADVGSTSIVQRPVEELSLICALSHKRLKDPVLLDTVVVERAVARLHQPGGFLFRPGIPITTPAVAEIGDHGVLKRILAQMSGLPSDSTLVLEVNNIGAPPASFLATLDAVARDFVLTIRRANQTDLVARGPLELKSVNVIPPQIVLDQEGLLAVFTGRGCGTARDVNFFRPTNGGDTEVDVNDVSHALEKVTIARKLEDTWQVDSFGEVSAVSRPPDEAIVLCLDLSESMNQRSGVGGTGALRDYEYGFNVEVKTKILVDKITQGMPRYEIMAKATAYLEAQHVSCYMTWAAKLNPDNSDGTAAEDLLRHLAVIASREALTLSFKEEFGDDSENDDSEDEDMYSSLSEASYRRGCSDALSQLACFIVAVDRDDMTDELPRLLRDATQKANLASVGTEPFNIPRALVDFKTGDLLLDPLRPKNAPKHTFVNSTSKLWFESQRKWPSGPCVAKYDTVTKLKKDVADWIAGTDILPKLKGTSKNDTISVTFRHLDQDHSWILLPQTSVLTLYSLVNRASRGVYASFILRSINSNSRLKLTDGPLISQTDLARGGEVEIVFCSTHTRHAYEVDISPWHGGPAQKILMPQDASILAVLNYLDNAADSYIGMTDFMLWHGVGDSGDGTRRGNIVGINTLLSQWDRSSVISHTISFESQPWRWIPTHGQRLREESKHLSRLHLLKTLFDVFINRASSFDTTVSLVLGLVTFSDKASVELELTPVFEKFREKLETVDAAGDTAVYDALDSARQVLTNFRLDLPNLRRRIIIVSDGEDTTSKSSAYHVCRLLQKGRIIVDSVQVGLKTDRVLHAISVATGGYRFSPRTSLADALSIFDLETMLYSGDRPFRSAKPLVNTERQFKAYQNFNGSNAIDIVTVDTFPPRAEHKKLKQRVKFAATSPPRSGVGDDRMKRIMREIKAVVADPHPNVDVYVNDRDMSFLKIILEAPEDVDNCPYEGGTFLLTCDLPAGYPRDPPEVRFVTFILHPNVSKQGKVCIAELGRLWSSDITLKEIFSMIYGTLLTPDLENPLEIQASLKYYDDDGTYALAVADAVAKHASKSRAQWQDELDD